MTFRVKFEPMGIVADAEAGQTVMQVALKAHVQVNAVCAGSGTCGKCRVRLSSGSLGSLRASERKLLGQDDIEQGWRLACAALVESDCTVEVPDDGEAVILEEAHEAELQLDPTFRVARVTVRPATLEDASPDARRMLDALCEVGFAANEVASEALRTLPEALRAEGGAVSVLVSDDACVLRVVPGHELRAYGLAIDIGTTTMVVFLHDLESGDLLARASMLNPQIGFGDDVVSRLCAATDAGQSEELRAAVWQGVNELIERVCEQANIVAHDICEATVACNTAMHHLALGIDSRALGRAPFVPVTSDAVTVSARDLGMGICPLARVWFFPILGNFVGGDTAAALLACQPLPEDGVTLLADIGTNSELCLVDKGRLCVTSCATGPALEGAHIGCGMRAAAGAVERVSIDAETLEPQLGVVGDGELPKGICGSGIVDAVAAMAQAGIIDRSGRFNKECASDRVRKNDKGAWEYVLFDRGDVHIAVTQKDVREIQLAKAALYAGARELMDLMGCDGIDHVLLAGAFGTYLDKRSALALGMYPDCALKDVVGVGNAAGLGARMALLSREKRTRALELARGAQVIDTAAIADFQQRFADSMAIPHSRDAFCKNVPATWSCNPVWETQRRYERIPQDPNDFLRSFAHGRFALAPGNTVPLYPYESMDEIVLPEDLTADPFLGAALAAIEASQERLVLELPGPMSMLSQMIDPMTLYVCRDADALAAMLDEVGALLVAYARECIARGVRVVSVADVEGSAEIVGKRFFSQVSGPALMRFLRALEPSLRTACVHLCAKTSFSLVAAGLARSYPVRVEGASGYYAALDSVASRKDLRFVGNNCIHRMDFDVPVLYRLELV